MNYRTLKYFIKIAECKSLTKAGSDLGVSVSTLSRYVSQIEADLEAPLFHREGSLLVLTRAGELYYQGTRRLLELQNKTKYEITRLDNSEQSRIRIGLTPSGASLFTSLYPLLIQRFPNLDISIVEGYAFGLLEGIRKGKIDMLLGYYNPAFLSDMSFASFYRNEVFLAVPAYHPAAASGSRDLSAIPVITQSELDLLGDIPFASFSDETIMGTLIEQEFKHLNFKPFSNVRSNNSQLVQSLLMTGYYAGFTYYQNSKDNEHLVYFHMPHPIYMYTAAVFHKDHTVTEYERYLCTRHAAEYYGTPASCRQFNRLAEILTDDI